MNLAFRLGALGLTVALLSFLLGSGIPAALLDLAVLQGILLAQVPLIMAQAILSLRLRMAIGRRELRLLSCLRASLFAQLADLLLPWRLSEILRVLYLRERVQVPLAEGVAAGMFERVADIVLLALLAVLVVGEWVAGRAAWSVPALAGVLVLGLMCLPRLSPMLHRAVGFVPVASVRNLLRATLQTLVCRVRDRSLWRILVPSVAIWGLAIAGTWIYLVMMPIQTGVGALNVTVGLVLAICVATALGNIAAVLPAGIGTYEAAVVLVLAPRGVPTDQAVLWALGLHATHVFSGAVGGLALAFAEPINIGDFIRRARAFRGRTGLNGAAQSENRAGFTRNVPEAE
jgi:hypothetical protein